MYKKKSLYLILTIIVVILTITLVVSINYFYTYSSIKNDVGNILKEVIGISLFIIIALFFTIRHFVMKPLFITI
jgi:polyferredoxin